MTVLAARTAYDDYDEDYRSDLDSKYEEGFGQGPDLGYDDEDDIDDLFAGLFEDEDDEDDDEDGLAPATEPKRAAAKRPEDTEPPAEDTELAPESIEPAAEDTEPPAEKTEPPAEDTVPAPEKTESPAEDTVLAALAEAASRARVAAESAANAAKRAVTEAAAKAAEAKAAAAEASAAEEAAQAALARSTEAEATAREAAERLAEAQASAATTAVATPSEAAEPDVPESGTTDVDEDSSEASEAPEPAGAVVREAAPVPDPLFAPAIAPVNEHVEFLRRLRPGLEVPYVDPMHSAEECRIVSLFSNTGEASPRGFVWAGDDAAATRLLGLQYQLGLRPEWMVPWNVYPWFTPGEANGKLAPEQVQAGLKPLLALLKLLPRASAIVAHGPEANRLAQQLLKTGNPLIWRRGLKVYKARSLHGRAFAGSKERQTEWLIEMGTSYADAMARAGVQLRRA